MLKSSRGQPLQDTSNNHTEFTDGNWKVTPRSREPSIGSENDPESRRTSTSGIYRFLLDSFLNSSPNNKSIDWSKLKGFADDCSNVSEMIIIRF